MKKTFFDRLSYVSENVFGEVFSVMNKRGQGFASGCTLLNVFFVLYATFFLTVYKVRKKHDVVVHKLFWQSRPLFFCCSVPLSDWVDFCSCVWFTWVDWIKATVVVFFVFIQTRCLRFVTLWLRKIFYSHGNSNSLAASHRRGWW